MFFSVNIISNSLKRSAKLFCYNLQITLSLNSSQKNNTGLTDLRYIAM